MMMIPHAGAGVAVPEERNEGGSWLEEPKSEEEKNQVRRLCTLVLSKYMHFVVIIQLPHGHDGAGEGSFALLPGLL
jgi:hypothetical protein